jgi:hypothetical protein
VLRLGVSGSPTSRSMHSSFQDFSLNVPPKDNLASSCDPVTHVHSDPAPLCLRHTETAKNLLDSHQDLCKLQSLRETRLAPESTRSLASGTRHVRLLGASKDDTIGLIDLLASSYEHLAHPGGGMQRTSSCPNTSGRGWSRSLTTSVSAKQACKKVM